MSNGGSAETAFSAQAATFDFIDVTNPITTWMRWNVQRLHDEFIQSGESVLEVTAGTGIDAIRLAKRGVRVVATDGAIGMVEQMKGNVERANLESMIQVLRLSLPNLTPVSGEMFDHVISNFGGLNCVANVPQVIAELANLVRPGGTLILVLMPPWSLWEFASIITRGPRSATRRLLTSGTPASVEGIPFPSWYYKPADVVAATSPQCHLEVCQPLGLLCPPPHHGSRAKKWPRTYRLLMRSDDRIRRFRWLSKWADHYVLVLRRHM